MIIRLPPDDARYFFALLKQYRENRKTTALRIGKNFFPSAVLSPFERVRLLAAQDYERLLKFQGRYQAAARKVRLTLNPMNGGIGTSLNREEYLKKIWPLIGRKVPVRLGAKGSDLFFEVEIAGKSGLVSISEAKILRAIHERGKYRETILEELASSDTAPSVRQVLGATNLFHRLGVKSRWGRLNYSQIFSKTPGLALKPVRVQAALPTLNAKGWISVKRKAPGGHGFWGQRFLLSNEKNGIHAIYNEDGINNTVDPVIVGWIAAEKIPVVILTTTKTGLDKKGGLLGVIKSGRENVRKEILEEAQARSTGQVKIFEEMGITKGKKGGQFFNTNTALINYAALSPLMKDLTRILGRKKIEEIVTPRLIQNKKGGYIQLEGALGSSILNLDGFLQTSKDASVRRALKNHRMLGRDGRVSFLRILNAGVEHRVKFFTPIKTARDFRLQFGSGKYRFNMKSWMLEKNETGSPPTAPRTLSSWLEV